MPVTARLSKKLYDTLGEDIAQELVDWFNQVDATSRGDLKELNELNFARFDAKLEQRTAELDAKLEQRTAELDARIEQRTAELGAQLGARLTALEAKLDQRADALGDRMTHLFAQADDRLEKAIASLRAEIIKWMFLFVVGTALAVIGIMSRLVG
jgi:uncharacterized protein YicC (UPF0701 family)